MGGENGSPAATSHDTGEEEAQEMRWRGRGDEEYNDSQRGILGPSLLTYRGSAPWLPP